MADLRELEIALATVGLRNSPAIHWKGLAFLTRIKMRG
jgi:hypothetical protein